MKINFLEIAQIELVMPSTITITSFPVLEMHS